MRVSKLPPPAAAKCLRCCLVFASREDARRKGAKRSFFLPFPYFISSPCPHCSPPRRHAGKPVPTTMQFEETPGLVPLP